MTALLATEVLTPAVKPRRVGVAPSRRPVAPVGVPPREASWVHLPQTPAALDLRPDAEGHGAPAAWAVATPSAAPASRYEWTPRGLAVLLTLVAMVFLTMAGTLVSAFLAVSPAPLGASTGAPAVVAVAGR